MTKRRDGATTLLAFLLSACGGGGATVGLTPGIATLSDATVVAPQFRDSGWQGPYGATATGSPSRQIIFAMSPEWGLLGVYGENASSGFNAQGQLWGSGPINAPMPIADPERTDVSGELTVDPGSDAVSGTVSWGSEERSVSGGAWSPLGYRHDQPATLAAVVGHWDLLTSQGRRISMDIDASGAISGTSGSCSIVRSTIAPTKTGAGLFAITLRFQSGSLGCSEPHGLSDGVHGFALVYPSTDSRAQLVVGATNGWDAVFLSAAGKR